jgi:hypothetical protein
MNLSRLFILVNFTLLPFLIVRTPATAAQPGDAAIKVHWLGLSQMSADTNAAQFMKIWHLPETVALANQTLDKLSRWPGGGVTNTVSQSLRPLLDDLVADEFYVEVFRPTNSQPSTLNSQLLLALRLPSARAALWQTNLATVFTALTGQKPVASKTGWRLAATRYGQVELTRADAWTILALGPASNERMPSFIASLPPAPGHASPAGNWLEADLDLPRLTDIRPVWLADLKLPVSGFKFQVAGEHGEILTRGTATLAQPWTAELPAWDIPTNTIHGPLSSFTALRGLDSLLAAWPAWTKTGLTPAPNQAVCWAQAGLPFNAFFAAPLPDGSNQLRQLGQRLVQAGNPWLASHATGFFECPGNPAIIRWRGALIASPFLQSIPVGRQTFVMGGLAPDAATGPGALPAEILQPLQNGTNLVFYQFEQTWQRLEDDLMTLQLLRVLFHQAQLAPAGPEVRWLKALEDQVGDTRTTVSRLDSHRLSLVRTSTLGLSALELHLLADWLESPAFPRGFHTFLAPPDQK